MRGGRPFSEPVLVPRINHWAATMSAPALAELDDLKRQVGECLPSPLRLAIEVSWMLENNSPIQNLIKAFGGQVCQTYRIYTRSIQ